MGYLGTERSDGPKYTTSVYYIYIYIYIYIFLLEAPVLPGPRPPLFPLIGVCGSYLSVTCQRFVNVSVALDFHILPVLD